MPGKHFKLINLLLIIVAPDDGSILAEMRALSIEIVFGLACAWVGIFTHVVCLIVVIAKVSI